MTRNRIRLGLAVAALGLALSTGSAAAQTLPGSGNSGGDVGPNRDVTTPVINNDVLGETEVRPETDEQSRSLALTEPASEGTLPFTGGDVVGLTIIGAAALGAGTVLVRRSRSRSRSAA